jgi:hypothetical protein
MLCFKTAQKVHQQANNPTFAVEEELMQPGPLWHWPRFASRLAPTRGKKNGWCSAFVGASLLANRGGKRALPRANIRLQASFCWNQACGACVPLPDTGSVVQLDAAQLPGKLSA